MAQSAGLTFFNKRGMCVVAVVIVVVRDGGGGGTKMVHISVFTK